MKGETMEETLKNKEKGFEKSELIDTACRELLTYGLWDGKTKCKRFVKKHILRRQTAVEDLIFWPTGLLAVGLVNCQQELSVATAESMEAGDLEKQLCGQIEAALATYFARWQKKGCPITVLDDLLAGEAFLSVYMMYREKHVANCIIDEQNAEQYRQAVDKLAAYAFSYPTDETGSFPYRANQQNGYVFVDSVGLTCPFLYEYGTYFEQEKGVELAVRQITNFLAYGMDAATGLPYHGYDKKTGIKYGIIGWGRATGWLLRGMAGCMITDYGMERLREAYVSLVDAVISYQRKDGYFSWQLQALDGPADTSATGMICGALQEGIDRGILQGGVYKQALDKGVHAIQCSVRNGKVYDCSGECEGFSMYPQRYGAYPWALGMALLL